MAEAKPSTIANSLRMLVVILAVIGAVALSAVPALGESSQGILNPSNFTVDDDGEDCADAFFDSIQMLNQEGRLLAYHDRSDGGLFVTLCEMAFAGHTGLQVQLDDLGDDPLASLFSEELGAVLQIRTADRAAVEQLLARAGLGQFSHVLGRPVPGDEITLRRGGQVVYHNARSRLHQLWKACPTSCVKTWASPLVPLKLAKMKGTP